MYPPSTPMMMVWEVIGEIWKNPEGAVRPAKSPMMKQPVTFTKRVPTGKLTPKRESNQVLRASRSPVPTAPPAITAKVVLNVTAGERCERHGVGIALRKMKHGRDAVVDGCSGQMPSSFLTALQASAAKRRSSRLWAALICMRIRAWPAGTTG